MEECGVPGGSGGSGGSGDQGQGRRETCGTFSSTPKSLSFPVSACLERTHGVGMPFPGEGTTRQRVLLHGKAAQTQHKPPVVSPRQ